MPFSQFISIVLGILGSYYFIIILFDVLKSNSPAVQATNHTIRFESREDPVIIAEEPERIERLSNSEDKKSHEKYLPAEEREVRFKMKSPMIDLGLETISGEAYTVNAKNLSKFMFS
ncbi:MAG TPA: hypothetical protein VFI29_22990 [Hanamia sp.]|nr:hypothetical protein [Hanamia sp.]